MKSGEALETVLVGVFFIFALLLIPRILNSISVNNAALASKTSPGAAANSVWASLIGAGGDIGVGLVNKYGESLLDQGN